jgi:hypothetical protein
VLRAHHRYLHTFCGQSVRDGGTDPMLTPVRAQLFRQADRSAESSGAKAGVSGCYCPSENRPEAVGRAARGGSEHTAGQARYLPDGRLTPRGLMKGATSKAQMQMSWVDEDPLDHFLPRSVTKLTLLYHKVRDSSSGLRARAARMEVRCLSRSGVGRIRTARRVSPISP